MEYAIVDWQQYDEYVPIEIEENRFKLEPLHIYTKDGLHFGMDARTIIQIDNSAIDDNFGSFLSSIEDKLHTLIRNFFIGKEMREIFSNRQKIQEGLLEKLQKELNMKVCKFMIVYMCKK